MRTFNVDMIPGGSQTAVACNQYEKGDIWVFALYYDGGRYDIPAGATVSITGQKSDGTAFNVPAAISDNTVLVTVTEQMTAAYGKCVAEILVQNGDTVLYTANFYILVEVAAVQVPLADTTLPLSITAQDGTVYVQSDLEEATEQMIALAAQQQYQEDLASGVAQRVVEQYAGSTLAGSKQTIKSAIDALNSNLGNLSVFSLSTSLRFTSDPAAFLMSVWDQLPNADRTPCIVSITGTGGAVMCFAYRYSTGYGGAYMMHYSGTCGVVTVNNGTATWHAI